MRKGAGGCVITAARLAESLKPLSVELSLSGLERPVQGVELVESDRLGHVNRGDLVLHIEAEPLQVILQVHPRTSKG